MSTINPELMELRARVDAQAKEISELRGAVGQIDQIVAGTARQSVWQLIALLVTLLIAIGGGLAWQTQQLDKRLDLMERHNQTRFEALEKRIEQSEKNILARFEDLKQEVRAARQPAAR